MSLTHSLLVEALQIATDYGARNWLPGREVPLVTTATGHELRDRDRTYALSMDDETVRLQVLTGGPARLIAEEASFSQGLARVMVPQYIADAID